MGYDFFRDNDERPEALKESNDNFKASDMVQESPDLFESMDAEPKAEANDEAPAASAEANESEASEAIEAKENEIEEMIEDGASEEEVKEAVKQLKAMYNDEELEIPAEAKFKHKVDGEEVEVGLQELLNNYSGKQSWDKKFTELDQDRQQYKSELDIVNKYVNEFAEISQKDKVGGLIKLAESVGLNPLEYKKQLRHELLNHYGDYLKMNEQQRAYYDQQEELEYYRQLRETEDQRRQEQQAQQELYQRIGEVQQAHNIDNDRLRYLATELQETYQAPVTPENLEQLHTNLVMLDRVEGTLKQVDPNLLNDDNALTQLASLVRGNPNMTDEQMLATANKLWGNDVSKAVENLTKKVKVKKLPEAQKKDHNYNPKLNHVGSNLDFFE